MQPSSQTPSETSTSAARRPIDRPPVTPLRQRRDLALTTAWLRSLRATGRQRPTGPSGSRPL